MCVRMTHWNHDVFVDDLFDLVSDGDGEMQYMKKINPRKLIILLIHQLLKMTQILGPWLGVFHCLFSKNNIKNPKTHNQKNKIKLPIRPTETVITRELSNPWLPQEIEKIDKRE